MNNTTTSEPQRPAPLPAAHGSATGPMSVEAEQKFEDYRNHRKLYQRLVLAKSEQADATFKCAKSAALMFAEQIFMEREYSAAGKVWKE